MLVPHAFAVLVGSPVTGWAIRVHWRATFLARSLHLLSVSAAQPFAWSWEAPTDCKYVLLVHWDVT